MAVRLLKTMAETALLQSGAAGLARWRHRADALVLAWHNVVPDDARFDGDASLHITRSRFAAQLDLLRATHDIVPLAEVLDAAPAGRPRIAITFDDAYVGTLTCGMEEVRRRGLPATLFVPPAFLGGRSFWWDALADAGSVEAAARQHVLGVLGGQDDRARRWATDEGRVVRTPPDYACAAGEDLLRRAVDAGGLTLASHTWSHVNLTGVTDDVLREELERPIAWLAQRFPSAQPWISYPYGLVDERVEVAAARAGYTRGFSLDGRWLNGSDRALRLPRLNIPAGVSPAGFALRAAGVIR
jgi:peptidoglycan/xylan/chitin deacetylase (PgdA/CDA1 family)